MHGEVKCLRAAAASGRGCTSPTVSLAAREHAARPLSPATNSKTRCAVLGCRSTARVLGNVVSWQQGVARRNMRSEAALP